MGIAMKRRRKRPRRIRRLRPASIVRAGYNQGYDQGYNAGYDQGYNSGRAAGAESSRIPFEGTSIIIPTYNKLDFLKECIESIRAYTPEFYELIVIDNASTDGTYEYLKQLPGNKRFRRNAVNLGFAGAINQGMMMAKGSTILLLNNDTIVTPNWLGNLLACVNSDPQIGMAGPVTNYISGDQMISVPYKQVSEMQPFAKGFNRHDPGKWNDTNRLVGFCVIIRRDVFNKLGYMDEGYEIGNYEDEDYIFRARLLGYRLVAARDTFIHHYGSVSMKMLGSEFEKVNNRNAAYFKSKWQDVPNQPFTNHPGRLSMADFYPTHVVVKGPGSRFHWIENGMRHPLEPFEGIVFTRLSRTDLRNWPVGPPVDFDTLIQKLSYLTERHASGWQDGQLVSSTDGNVFQFAAGKLRRLAGATALKSWGFDKDEIFPISLEERIRFPEGLPIIAPTQIRSSFL